MNLFVAVIGLTVTVALAEVAAGQTAEHWYRCNTHTHTASFPTSDANASPELPSDGTKRTDTNAWSSPTTSI